MKEIFKLINGEEYTREEIIEYVNEINGFDWRWVMKQKKFVKPRCPICNSTQIYFNKGQMLVCRACGYRGE